MRATDSSSRPSTILNSGSCDDRYASSFSASVRSASAAAMSISLGSTPRSARTMTRSGSTSANPHEITIRSTVEPARYRRVPMRRLVRSGVCPGRTPISPSLAGSTTSSTSISMNFRSRVTTVRAILVGSVSAIEDFLRCLALHLLVLLEHLLDRSLQQERLLRNVVVLPFDDLAEAADGLGDLDVLPRDAGELLGDVERLREEALHLAGAVDDDAVFFRQLVDAENGDDVLEVLVLLQDRLDRTRGVVVLVAHDARIENARGRLQRID